MSPHRRALAALPVAVALAAPPAQAAEIKTLPCVPYIAGTKTLPVTASGFRPNRVVEIYWNTNAKKTPRLLTSSTTDAAGGFRKLVRPPRFTKRTRNIERFNLIAAERSDPRAPVIHATSFRVVRFGMNRRPRPKRPGQTVKWTARGFIPNKRVYAHFRFGSITRRTVSLGIARGRCGTTSRRMRALPTKVRYGAWQVYIDQSKRFSRRTRPQWIDPFTISRVRTPRPKP